MLRSNNALSENSLHYWEVNRVVASSQREIGRIVPYRSRTRCEIRDPVALAPHFM